MPTVEALLRIGGPFFAIAGPCVIESAEMVLETAARLRRISDRCGVPLIFKSSYLKDNRTSRGSYRGPGVESGLEILGAVKRETGLPVLSDVHTEAEARQAGNVLDVVQIPAFLCRQTRLIEAAASTGRPLNVKKGQFLPPQNARFIVEKAREAGATHVAVTERGACFGYGDLVVDPRTFQILAEMGVPGIFDATHSLQKQGGSVTGGERRFLRTVARAAVAAGAVGVFFETHPNPPAAQSDRDTQLPLDEAEGFLGELAELARCVARMSRPDGHVS